MCEKSFERMTLRMFRHLLLLPHIHIDLNLANEFCYVRETCSAYAVRKMKEKSKLKETENAKWNELKAGKNHFVWPWKQQNRIRNSRIFIFSSFVSDSLLTVGSLWIARQMKIERMKRYADNIVNSKESLNAFNWTWFARRCWFMFERFKWTKTNESPNWKWFDFFRLLRRRSVNENDDISVRRIDKILKLFPNELDGVNASISILTTQGVAYRCSKCDRKTINSPVTKWLVNGEMSGYLLDLETEKCVNDVRTGAPGVEWMRALAANWPLTNRNSTVEWSTGSSCITKQLAKMWK